MLLPSRYARVPLPLLVHVFVTQVRFKYSSRPDVLVLDDVSFAASPGMMVRNEEVVARVRV